MFRFTTAQFRYQCNHITNRLPKGVRFHFVIIPLIPLISPKFPPSHLTHRSCDHVIFEQNCISNSTRRMSTNTRCRSQQGHYVFPQVVQVECFTLAWKRWTVRTLLPKTTSGELKRSNYRYQNLNHRNFVFLIEITFGGPQIFIVSFVIVLLNISYIPKKLDLAQRLVQKSGGSIYCKFLNNKLIHGYFSTSFAKRSEIQLSLKPSLRTHFVFKTIFKNSISFVNKLIRTHVKLDHNIFF